MIIKRLLLSMLVFLSLSAFANGYKNVALVSVSSAYDENTLPDIELAFKNKGYNVTEKYLDQRISDLGYVNIESVRAKSLIDAMKDDSIDIIWFVRGGGGSINILPLLEKSTPSIKKHKEKILVGFSDVTPILSYASDALGWRAIHGVVASFNKDVHAIQKEEKKETIDINMNEEIPNVQNLIDNGLKYNGLIPLNKNNNGTVRGIVGGGNLTLFLSTMGTRFHQNLKDKILIIESPEGDDGYRRLDRRLNQLLFLDDINTVKGIIFGQFAGSDATEKDRLIYKKVISDFAKKTTLPVFYYPYFGHGKENIPFIFNGNGIIKCEKNSYYCSFLNNLND